MVYSSFSATFTNSKPMIFYLGALWTPPLVLAFNLLVVVGLAGVTTAGLQVVFGADATTAADIALALSTGICLVSVVALVLFVQRRYVRSAFPLGFRPLFGSDRQLQLGPKAAVLRRLMLDGLAVAPGVVVQVRSTDEKPLRSLARQVVLFAQSRGIAEVIVRSSFAEEDEGHVCAGVFESVRDVPGDNVEAIEAALHKVATSRHGPRARDLAPRTPEAAGASCVLVQEQIQHTHWGVLASVDPETRRPDHIYLEMYDRTGQLVTHCRYQVVLGRWLDRNQEFISREQAEQLIGICMAAESLLTAPVVIEFGLFEQSVVVYQARRMPHIDLCRVWTNTGVVDLNPEPNPELLVDLAYGVDLAGLREHIWQSRGVAVGGDQPDEAPEFRLIEGRPYLNYTSFAAKTRFRSLNRTSVLRALSLLRRGQSLRRPRNAAETSIGRPRPVIEQMRCFTMRFVRWSLVMQRASPYQQTRSAHRERWELPWYCSSPTNLSSGSGF